MATPALGGNSLETFMPGGRPANPGGGKKAVGGKRGGVEGSG